MNFRRRLMMAQQSKGYELVYNAASGVYPENIEGWKYRAGYYNGRAAIGGRSLKDGLLILKANHIYENIIIYPTEHLTATNCEASVTVTDWYRNVAAGSGYGTGIVRIGLTDGINYAIAAVSNDALYIGNAANNNTFSGNYLAKITITTPKAFTFRVKFMGGKAEYYINDELIYTQTNQYSVNNISYGNFINRFVDIPQNFIGVGTCCIATISNMTYKEW